MKNPHEQLGEFISSFTDEELAEIDRSVADAGHATEPVELLDDPDPLGRDWDWLEGPGEYNLLGKTIPIGGTARAPGRPEGYRRRFVWASAAAASLAAVAVGSWFAFSSAPLRERDVTAWVAQKLVTGGGGIRIAAPAGDDEKAEEPLIRGLDRPHDAVAPSAPNVYAPLRIQDQLVIPEVPPSLQPAQATRRPVRSVAENVRPGELFYLEFATASTPSPGTAVVVSSREGSLRLLWDEIAVSPADGTGYFGPIKMADGEASYFVILADRTGTSLLSTASRALAKADGATLSPESLRERISAALEESGHSWYAVQRIQVRPEQIEAPSPKPVP